MKKRLLIALVVLLALAATASLVWANGGLVGYWPFDEGTGITAYDVVNGNHGTIVGAGWTTDRAPVAGNQYALAFDGNDYVSVPDSGTLDFGTGDFTVAAWIKVNGSALVAYKEYGVVDKNAYFQGTPGWGIEVTTWCAAGTELGVEFYITNQVTWLDTNAKWCAGEAWDEWHHIAGVRQGTTTRLYFDGDLVATKTHQYADDNVDNGQPVIIGDHSWGPNYPGVIDEVGIWNRALSADQVAILARGSVEWLPPLALDEWTLNENATLPIKFQLYVDDDLFCTPADVTLQVTGYSPVAPRFDPDGCYYIVNFRPDAPGMNLTATVYASGAKVGASRPFDIVQAGTPNGRGRSN